MFLLHFFKLRKNNLAVLLVLNNITIIEYAHATKKHASLARKGLAEPIP